MPPWRVLVRREPELPLGFLTPRNAYRGHCARCSTGHACFLDAKDGLIPSPFMGDKLLTMTINHKIKSLKNRHTQ